MDNQKEIYCNALGDDNRKLLKPCRHIYSNRVYLSHSHGQNLYSNSSYNILQPAQVPQVQKHVPVPKLNIADNHKDTCTQTSKTILQLAQMEADKMSPDSLTDSPKNRNKKSNQSPLPPGTGNHSPENYSLDGSVCEQTVTYRRKNSCVEPVEDKEVFRQKSLTETFLNKTKNRNAHKDTDTVYFNSNLTSESSSLCDNENRTKFLQQTSPFRNLITEDSPRENASLKSQSFVDTFRPNYVLDFEQTPQKKPPQINRFTIKSVTNKPPNEDDVKPVKYYCQKQMLTETDNEESQCQYTSKSEVIGGCGESPRKVYSSRRSSSFMSPTIASEKKNQLPNVRNISRLISPTRRGRSTSPKVTNYVERLGAKQKIPYIDQSRSGILKRSRNQCKSESRKSMTTTTKVSTTLSPVSTKPGLDEDLMKIDSLSLNIRSSEDTLSGSGMITDSNSICSSDNAISGALNKVKERDWNVALKGLAEITELCRLLDGNLLYPHMTTVNQRLIELLRSPRSHVCRTACQAAGHLFESMKDTRRPEFDDIVNILLFKTADANKFIRQDANLALDCMVTHICTFHAVRSLCCKGPIHKNPLVRTATARLLVCSVVIAGVDNLLNPNNSEHTRKRVIQQMQKFVEDKNFETRKYGERLYKILSKEPNFDIYLKRYVDKEEIVQMKKMLKCNAKK